MIIYRLTDKLYQTYQVFADRGTALEVRALTAGQGYFFAVEAFNENGISPLSRIVRCKAPEGKGSHDKDGG